MGWMMWRELSRYGMADIARHVIGYHSTQETRVQNALRDVTDVADVAGNRV
jgi:hypothetical protein